MNELDYEKRKNKTLSDELYRIRTVENAAAHALDCLRQDMGLELILQEHPKNTMKRIRDEIQKRI